MQMDINKIFNLFDGSSLENQAEAASDTIIIQETPMFWIGMFKKIILNNYVFYHQIKNHLPEDIIKEIDGGDDLANMVTYSRAWFYISKVDLKRRVDIDALFTFMDKDLLHTTKWRFAILRVWKSTRNVLILNKFKTLLKKCWIKRDSISLYHYINI